MNGAVVVLLLALGLAAVSGGLLLPAAVDYLLRALQKARLRERLTSARGAAPVGDGQRRDGHKDGKVPVLVAVRRASQTLLVDALRNGVVFLRAPARLMLCIRPPRHAAAAFAQVQRLHGMQATTQTGGELLCLAAAAGFVVGLVLTGQAVLALCTAVLAPWLPVRHARKVLQRRDEALREQIPDALRSIGLCFSAGLSLQQALLQTAQETPEPLGGALVQTGYDMQAGCSVPEALTALQQRTGSRDLQFVAVALEIQHTTGGSLQDILENAATAVTAAFELRRSLKVQTAQARMSARIVSLMPVALVAVLSLAMEGYLQTFFSSTTGFLLLVTALAMEVIGVLAIRRILGIGLD